LWITNGEVTVDAGITLTITEGNQIFTETQTTLLKVDPTGVINWQGKSTDSIVFDTLANAPG